MRKVKLYIASSLDGYIARLNGNLDWLTGHYNPQELDYGYEEFYETIETIIMGRETYQTIIDMGGEWAYREKLCYIATRQKSIKSTKESLLFTTEKMESLISSLRVQEGKDIWLVGGGRLISTFLEYNLIDTMIITYIPTMLGRGIPLFPNQPTESKWRVVKCETFDNGVIQIEYEINR